MARHITQSGQYHQNGERTGAMRDGYEPCIVCGRAVNVQKPHWRTYVHHGGGVAVTEEEYDALNAEGHGAAQMGTYPVGPECRRSDRELAVYTVRVSGFGGAQ